MSFSSMSHKACLIEKIVTIILGLILLLISLVFPVIISSLAKIIVTGVGVIIIIWAIIKPCAHQNKSCN